MPPPPPPSSSSSSSPLAFSNLETNKSKFQINQVNYKPKTRFGFLKLLVWKNYTLKRRRPLSTLVEISLPLLLFLVLLVIRIAIPQVYNPEKYYPSLCLPTNVEPCFFPNDTDTFRRDTPNQTSGLVMPNLDKKTTDSMSDLLHDTLFTVSQVLEILQNQKILYAPKGGDVDKIINILKKEITRAFRGRLTTLQIESIFIGLNSEDEMMEYIHIHGEFVYGMAFRSVNTSIPFYPTLDKNRKDIDYALRLPFLFTPLTRNKEFYLRPYPDTNFSYYNAGFVLLQDFLEKAIIEFLTGAPPPPLNIYLNPFPWPEYYYDNVDDTISSMFPMIMTLSFIYSAALLVKNIVYEKELRIKEIMKMMGLMSSVYRFSWYIVSLCTMTVSIIIISIILIAGGVLSHSNGLLMFLFLFAFILATISFSFLISVFFSRARIASACGGILYFVTYIPYVFLDSNGRDFSYFTKLVCCLFSTTAFGQGSYYLVQEETKKIGINFSNFGDVAAGDNFSFKDAFFMMLFDAVLYFVIGWYIEEVFPGRYGVPRRWYFPFTKSYWLGLNQQVSTAAQQSDNDAVQSSSTSSLSSSSPNFETDPLNLSIGIKVNSLSKTYDNGKKALKDVSFRLYEGQIAALLGHNGAGKSTIMSILCGLFPPSSGTAFINGYSIKTDIEGVRQSLGVCPQFNALFGELTSREHLEFFSYLKGVDPSFISKDVESMLQNIQMMDKADLPVSSLSGGMKRKLSAAIAFIGGSKTIILDEPTAGVDPYSRRIIWDLLLAFKESRTILVSTHHMDEADVLADRIAIIGDGQLKCLGSPLFLKNHFGIGYNLSIVKNSSKVNPMLITEFLKSHVPSTTLKSETELELVYLLPTTECGAFPSLFSDLESKFTSLGIANYGLGVSTLEEVFLKVDELDTIATTAAATTRSTSLSSSSSSSSSSSQQQTEIKVSEEANNEGSDLKEKLFSNQSSVKDINQASLFGTLYRIQQLVALVLKRFHHAKRDKKAMVSQLLVPVVFIIIALSVSIPPEVIEEAEPLVLNTGVLTLGNNILYGEYGPNQPELSHRLLQRVFEQKAFLDEFQNVSDRNLPLYLLETRWSFQRTVFGAYSFDNSVDTNDTVISNITCWFKNEANNAMPVFLNRFHNALLAELVNSSTKYSLNLINHNWPQFAYSDLASVSTNPDHLLVGIFFIIAFSFVPASFVLFVVSEKHTKSKHLQFVSGVNSLVYWTSMIIWDFFVFLLPIVVTLIIIVLYKDSVYNDDGYGATGLLFLFYVWSITPLMYCLSFLFTVPPNAYVTVICLNLVTGITTTMTTFVIDLFVANSPALSSLNSFLKWIFPVLPNYCLGRGLMDIAINKLLNEYYQLLNINKFSSPFSLNVIGYNLIWMGLEGVFFFGLILVIEHVSVNPHYKDKWLSFKQSVLSWKSRQSRFRKSLLSTTDESDDIYLDSIVTQTDAKSGNYDDDNDDDDDGDNDSNSDIPDYVKNLRAKQNLESSRSDEKNSPTVIRQNDENEDEDVYAERVRVNNKISRQSPRRDDQDIVVFHDLTKVFNLKNTPKVAVDHLSVALPAGKCFGLLGVNGAGKTTTFRMLTGDLKPTSGDAYIGGYSINNDMNQVRRIISYCPQFDAFNELLTGRELLYLYARLRGLLESHIPAVVDWCILKLQLTQFADRQCGSYSGGNKRKLSTAITLLGSPSVILMDEPTTGMDPTARRFLWSVILSILKDGCSIIFTSHSMEECEALCSSMAIMINGKFKCIGSAQHLKTRFGVGYTLSIKIKEEKHDDVERLKDYIIGNFSDAILKENHAGLLKLQLPSVVSTHDSLQNSSTKSCTLATVFKFVEETRILFPIEGYSINQTTLEEIFVGFVNSQPITEN